MNFLKSIFGKNSNNNNPEARNLNFDQLMQEIEEEETPDNLKTKSFPNHNIPIFPGLNIEKHYQKITFDLGEYGMKESIVRRGNPKNLGVLFSHVRSAYLEELEVLKEAVRNDAINKIHQCSQQIINNTNKLRHINENLIPETKMEIEEALDEIRSLEARSADEFADLNSGYNTSLISEIRRTILTFRKNIREMKSTSIGLQSDNARLENEIAQLKANIESFEPYQRVTLDHKLNTFMTGWLRGLEMANANPEFTQKANEIFSDFLIGLDDDETQSTTLKKIA